MHPPSIKAQGSVARQRVQKRPLVARRRSCRLRSKDAVSKLHALGSYFDVEKPVEMKRPELAVASDAVVSGSDVVVIPAPVPLPYGGRGTGKILTVTRALEDNGILCCLVGTSALIFYGANRGRLDWNIAVPTEQFSNASRLLRSSELNQKYLGAPPYSIQIRSLAHTYPRFQCSGTNVFFQLFPSNDCHLECKTANIVRSHNDLPYPRLDVFMQSLLDTSDDMNLVDLVDGTDVTEDWGNQHLDLSGTVDASWAQWKNDLICAQTGSWNIFLLHEVDKASRRAIWDDAIHGKEQRLGWKYPKELFATRFRLRGSIDPWLKYRDSA